MYYSEEQIKRANERSIVEYFAREGYSCKHSGRETHIEGFGGFYVKDDSELFYIHSQQKGGKGLISCLMKVFDMPFTEAVRNALDGELGQESHRDTHDPMGEYSKPVKSVKPVKKEEAEKPEFEKPEQGADNRKTFAYLTQTRCISPDVVNAFIRAKLLYQDIKGNAVFLHTVNGQSCGAELHGTSGKSYHIGNAAYKDIADRSFIPTEPCVAEIFSKTYKESDIKFSGYVYEKNANIVTESKDYNRVLSIISDISARGFDREAVMNDVSSKLENFKGVARGTTESYFQYNIGNPQRAFVFESSIDLMSFMTLHPDANNCKMVAMAGLKPSIIEKLLVIPIPVTLCVDNDERGSLFCRQFAGKCNRFTECAKNGVKDFNELLQKKTGVPFKKRIAEIGEWTKDTMQRLNEQQYQINNEMAVAR